MRKTVIMLLSVVVFANTLFASSYEKDRTINCKFELYNLTISIDQVAKLKGADYSGSISLAEAVYLFVESEKAELSDHIEIDLRGSGHSENISRQKMPVRKIVTGKETPPYRITEYIWIADKSVCDVRVFNTDEKDDVVLNLKYDWMDSQLLKDDKTEQDIVAEDTFSIQQSAAVKLNAASVVAIQKTADAYHVILVKLTPKK